MKTKMCIFNDRAIYMQLQIQDSDNSNRYQSILPATHAVVELNIEEGQIPYLKVWESGQALISSIDPQVLENK